MSLRRWLIKLLKAKPQEDLVIGKLFYNPDDYISFAVDKKLNAKYDFVLLEVNKRLSEYQANTLLQYQKIDKIDIVDNI